MMVHTAALSFLAGEAARQVVVAFGFCLRRSKIRLAVIRFHWRVAGGCGEGGKSSSMVIHIVLCLFVS